MPFDRKHFDEVISKTKKPLSKKDNEDKNSMSPDNSLLMEQLNKVKQTMIEPTTMGEKVYKGIKGVSEPLGEFTSKELQSPLAGKFVSNSPEIMSLMSPPIGAVADVAFAPTIKAGGEALGAAEKAAGVSVGPFSSADLPKTASDAIDFSQKLGKIAEKTPEQIAKVADPQWINYMRKVIEYTLDNFKENLPGANLSSISRAKDVLTKALDMSMPELAAPRQAIANAFTRQSIMSKIPGLAKTAKKAAIVGGF